MVPASLHHGINSLPVELLCSIFKLAVSNEDFEGDYTFEFKFNKVQITNLSGACFRFRQVIMSYPEFWTQLTDFMPASRICHSRSLSGSSALHVELGICKYKPETVESLLSCVDDWLTLKIDFKNCAGRSLLSRYPSLNCKKVEELAIGLWGFLGDDEDEDEEDEDDEEDNGYDMVEEFYARCSFPNLKHLRSRDINMVTAIDGFSRITEFTYFPEEYVKIRSLVAALQSTPSLIKLNICFGAAYEDEPHDNTLLKVRLPCLTSLCIDDVDKLRPNRAEVRFLLAKLTNAKTRTIPPLCRYGRSRGRRSDGRHIISSLQPASRATTFT